MLRRTNVEDGDGSQNRDVPQTGDLSMLDFLMCRKLSVHSSPGPDCALLSGPPRCGKTSLLLQLAYNIASESPSNVVFICKPRNFETDHIYLAQALTQILDRMWTVPPKSLIAFTSILFSGLLTENRSIFAKRYVRDEEELRKYFAAFHMHTDLPSTVIVDDFLEFFQGWDGRHQVGQARSSRELAIVKTLCLAHSAITYASEHYKHTRQCKLIISDSHHSDGPRLSYIFRRWVHQTFVIKAIHDLSAFTLALHDERGHGNDRGVAQYDLSQGYLRFDGWNSHVTASN